MPADAGRARNTTAMTHSHYMSYSARQYERRRNVIIAAIATYHLRARTCRLIFDIRDILADFLSGF